MKWLLLKQHVITLMIESIENFPVYAASYDSILKELKKNQSGFLSFKLILALQNIRCYIEDKNHM